jgi:lipoteichoic acid synthase
MQTHHRDDIDDSTPAQPTAEVAPMARLSPYLPIVAYLLFVVVLVSLEREVILTIADPGTYPPSLLWQLLWPIGLIATSLLFPPWMRWIFLGITGCASILVLAADSAYFAFFGTVTSMFMYTSLHQLVDVRDSVSNLISLQRLLPAILFLPLFGLGVWNVLRRKPAKQETLLPRGDWSNNPRAWTALLLVTNLTMGCIAWNIPIYEKTHHLGRENWIKPSEHWNSTYSRSSYASTFGVFNYHVMDLIGATRSIITKAPLLDERKEEIVQHLAHKKHLNDQKSPLWGIARDRHVIILQLESLQHFLLDLEVQGHEVTPVLNALSRNALAWDYIFDVTYIGRTSDAEFATMTGLLPDPRKPASYYALSDALVTLPKALKESGYATSSIHGFKRSFWNRGHTHPLYGIDEMHFEERFTEMPKMGLGPSDKDVLRYTADLLESNREQKQFLFFASLSSHHPYIYVPAKYGQPYAHLQLGAGYGLIAPYLASASYTDEAIGEFLQMLDERSLLEDSILVIYGDHDRGGLGAHKPIPEVGERMNSFAEDRIPMIIVIPGKEEIIAAHADEYRGVMGGLHDLFPTLLHLLGEEVPLGVLGTHLFVENGRRDPIPIPTAPGLFAYRGALALPSGKVMKSRLLTESIDKMPSQQDALVDQLAVQSLLDHYDGIMEFLFPVSRSWTFRWP